MMNLPPFVNQGHRIAPLWDAQANFKDWTAHFGTDGVRFAPPYDRNGYNAGVLRRMNTGGILRAGRIVFRLTHPIITDGQIEYLQTQMITGVSGPVTIAMHVPGSVGKADVSYFNAILNIDTDQLSTLTRRAAGYEGFVTEYVVHEVL